LARIHLLAIIILTSQNGTGFIVIWSYTIRLHNRFGLSFENESLRNTRSEYEVWIANRIQKLHKSGRLSIFLT